MSSYSGQVVQAHHYSVGNVALFVALVLFARTSLRAASRVFLVIDELLPISLGTPHWTTGRLWVLRLGYYKLTRPKQKADDWAWLVDHSIQIGTQKCLVILGIRLCNLPEAGECLKHEDLEPIDIIPVDESNKQIVCQQFEMNIEKTGVPRVIVKDDGSDLTGGATLFCERHSETSTIYDIKHKTARLLKSRLEKDSRWSEFNRHAGQTKLQMLQTELAFLVPPTLTHSKARYMNLEPLVRWGRKTLAILDAPPPEVLAHCSEQRLREKLNWLLDYRQSITDWSELLALLTTAEKFVRSQGLYYGASEEVAEQLEPLVTNDTSQSLCDELVTFVKTESAKARPGERLPGSTEVLESCFGKLKALEGDQCKSGFTGLLLSLGAIVAKTSTEVIQAALESTKTKDVLDWCQTKLGKSVQSKRQQAYKSQKPRNKNRMNLGWT